MSVNLCMCFTVELFGHHISDTHLKASSSGKAARVEITTLRRRNWQLSIKLASAYHLLQDASLMTDCRNVEDAWSKRSHQ